MPPRGKRMRSVGVGYVDNSHHPLHLSQPCHSSVSDGPEGLYSEDAKDDDCRNDAADIRPPSDSLPSLTLAIGQEVYAPVTVAGSRMMGYSLRRITGFQNDAGTVSVCGPGATETSVIGTDGEQTVPIHSIIVAPRLVTAAVKAPPCLCRLLQGQHCTPSDGDAAYAFSPSVRGAATEALGFLDQAREAVVSLQLTSRNCFDGHGEVTIQHVASACCLAMEWQAEASCERTVTLAVNSFHWIPFCQEVFRLVCGVQLDAQLPADPCAHTPQSPTDEERSDVQVGSSKADIQPHSPLFRILLVEDACKQDSWDRACIQSHMLLVIEPIDEGPRTTLRSIVSSFQLSHSRISPCRQNFPLRMVLAAISSASHSSATEGRDGKVATPPGALHYDYFLPLSTPQLQLMKLLAIAWHSKDINEAEARTMMRRICAACFNTGAVTKEPPVKSCGVLHSLIAPYLRSADVCEQLSARISVLQAALSKSPTGHAVVIYTPEDIAPVASPVTDVCFMLRLMGVAPFCLSYADAPSDWADVCRKWAHTRTHAAWSVLVVPTWIAQTRAVRLKHAMRCSVVVGMDGAAREAAAAWAETMAVVAKGRAPRLSISVTTDYEGDSKATEFSIPGVVLRKWDPPRVLGNPPVVNDALDYVCTVRDDSPWAAANQLERVLGVVSPVLEPSPLLGTDVPVAFSSELSTAALASALRALLS